MVNHRSRPFSYLRDKVRNTLVIHWLSIFMSYWLHRFPGIYRAQGMSESGWWSVFCVTIFHGRTIYVYVLFYYFMSVPLIFMNPLCYECISFYLSALALLCSSHVVSFCHTLVLWPKFSVLYTIKMNIILFYSSTNYYILPRGKILTTRVISVLRKDTNW